MSILTLMQSQIQSPHFDVKHMQQPSINCRLHHKLHLFDLSIYLYTTQIQDRILFTICNQHHKVSENATRAHPKTKTTGGTDCAQKVVSVYVQFV